MCSIKTRERESQCWDAAAASGGQQRDAGGVGMDRDPPAN